MNVQRYERAYLASLSANSSSSSAPPSANTGEGTIQKLVDEVLQSLSRCDPLGQFLGTEMTTGRWRVLNPVFAQLKTEQAFFECLQVKQRRRIRQLEAEWKFRIRARKGDVAAGTRGQDGSRESPGRGHCGGGDGDLGNDILNTVL